MVFTSKFAGDPQICDHSLAKQAFLMVDFEVELGFRAMT